jgi:hypothetical protein
MYVGMRKLLPMASIALALSVFPRVELTAWGSTGHRFIMDQAIDRLPPELKPFFDKFRATLVERSIDPDTYRTVGFVDEPPRHFLDMDSYGRFPFPGLPHDYNAAVAKFGADFVIKNGTLPWRTEEIYGRLKDAFKQLAANEWSRDNIKLFSAVLTHYVADAYQPFHACLNHDGQLTGQQGIHARFESELFDRYQSKLHITVAPLTPIPNAREFIFATLADSFQNVEPVLAADREAIQGLTLYDDEYFARMWTKAGPIMETRVAGAVTGVASIITQAWIDAGKPPLPAETGARPPRPIKR